MRKSVIRQYTMAFIRVTISERGPTFVTLLSPRPAGSISLEEEMTSLKLFLSKNDSGIWQSHVGDIPIIHKLGKLIQLKRRRQARISRRPKRKN
jgi:hypothetical protein